MARALRSPTGGEISTGEPRRTAPALLQRMRGPGGLYNVGNAIALSASLTMQVAGSAGSEGALQAVRAYLIGSPGATALSLAILIFFASGEAYFRAWSSGFPPDRRLNRWGDLLSGVGAVVLTAALVAFGDLALALLSGAMLAAGKFGNALLPDGGRRGTVFRALALWSRVPAVVTLGLQVGRLVEAGVGPAAPSCRW